MLTLIKKSYLYDLRLKLEPPLIKIYLIAESTLIVKIVAINFLLIFQ